MGQFYPLYDERMEHEACGVGAVVNLNGRGDHRAVDSALTIVERLAHRAGCDAEGATGDGVGIMTEIPHVLFSRWAAARGLSLGEGRDYGAAMLFLSADAAAEKAAFEAACRTEGLRFIAWRDVPVCPELLGRGARESMPAIVQGFVARPEETGRGAAFDRRLYVLRRRFEKAAPQAYVCSLSSRTIVYKGMMLVTQLRAFYPDLQQADYTSAAALVHSRFSTNTNPSWSKAHPHRMLLHNGEINTIRGNADRMLAREETMSSRLLGDRVETIYPIVNPTGSDSAMLDNALEFLAMNGVPLPLAGMILVPEAWQGRAEKTPWQAMYHYYSTLMEPWDGPAALLCFDGDSVLAMLDRNGLRPLRRMETDDGRLILSSEAGVLHEEEARVLRRGRLRGGELICADLRQGRLYESDALKSHFAALLPYEKWLEKGVLHLSDLPLSDAAAPAYDPRAAKALGYTYEDYFSVLIPMAEKGTEPIGSMGADIPLAALSKAHPPLFSYFKQRFAQVTNPPIDALREKSR
ncbi:MAG: glutamate synthase central domain-containing protein, partial [Clostridiales bacterium]|nr:glutamate synthase central domain-containing protein [Clostridiales bacterium]